MSTKLNVLNLLPANVIRDFNPSTTVDRDEIKEMLEKRSIVSSSRFLLEPGKYTFTSVEAVSWKNGKGKDAKEAVMCVIKLNNEAGEPFMTTIGGLRKIDSNMTTYGPEKLPVTEYEVLEMIEDQGLIIHEIVDVKVAVFTDGARVPDASDESNYKTKPAKFMRWSFGTPKAAAAKTGKK